MLEKKDKIFSKPWDLQSIILICTRVCTYRYYNYQYYRKTDFPKYSVRGLFDGCPNIDVLIRYHRMYIVEFLSIYQYKILFGMYFMGQIFISIYR